MESTIRNTSNQTRTDGRTSRARDAVYGARAQKTGKKKKSRTGTTIIKFVLFDERSYNYDFSVFNY